MRDLPPLHRSRSSVFYFFLLQLLFFWNVAYTIASIVLQGMKIYQFPTPKAAGDFSMVAPFLQFVFFLIQYFTSRLGNRSENFIVLIIALVFAVGYIMMEVYYLAWQPYEWAGELPLRVFALVLEVIAFLLTCVMLIFFAVRPTPVK